MEGVSTDKYGKRPEPIEEKSEFGIESKTGKKSTALSFDDFKKALGITALKYSNDQIEVMRITFDKIADNTFDTWLRRRNAHT